MRLLRLVLVSVACSVIGSMVDSASPFGRDVAFAQLDAGYLADVRDLATSVNYSASDNMTDLALALAPPQTSSGPGVTMLLRARFHGRAVEPGQLAQVILRVHYRLRSDDGPRAAAAFDDSHQLSLQIDPGTTRSITLSFFPTSWGATGFSGAGQEIPVAFFTLTPADLRAIGMAGSIVGQTLWTSFTLTSQQLQALEAFTGRVLPAPRPAPVAPVTFPGDVAPAADPRAESFWRERRRSIDARVREDELAATAAIEQVMRLERAAAGRGGDPASLSSSPAYVKAQKEMKRASDAVQYNADHLLPDFYAQARRANVPEAWLGP